MLSKSKKVGHSELCDLAENIGHFIEYWGFKKIHGQIWTLIFLSPQPLDATTLTQKLGVSKALISLAIKDLLHYQVIQVCGKAGRRTVYFRSSDDLTQVILSVLRRREVVLLENVAKSMESLENKIPTESILEFSPERFQELKDLVGSAQDFLNLLVQSRLHTASKSTF